MFQRANKGGGGSNVLKFQYNPSYTTYQNYIAIETSKISHFKGAINTALSAYGDYAAYKVGYANTIPTASNTMAFTTLTNAVSINGADFDVSTSYTYLVICSTEEVMGRVYDIELTLR